MIGVSAFKDKPGRNDFGKKLQSFANDAEYFSTQTSDNLKQSLENLHSDLNGVSSSRYKTFEKNGETIPYYEGFEVAEVENALKSLNAFIESIGGVMNHEGPDEDKPISFKLDQLPDHLELIAQEQGALQFLDFFIMRIRSLLSDNRMRSIIHDDGETTLGDWLEEYMSGTVVIDLSLVPSDVVHLIVAVISRIVFEALQRHRRKLSKVLPSVLVLEEAHNFIRKYHERDDVSPSEVCSQVFEKIAKEGRKFGLSLMLSSQRPSELSDTVLSQCNTFLLHRLVNDRDQDLVRRLVPDNIGGLLKELPILPTRKAILLGWASSIPILVEMNELEKRYRPNSSDPDFWEVWTGQSERKSDWLEIVKEWQGLKDVTKSVNDINSSDNPLPEKDEDGDTDDVPF